MYQETLYTKTKQVLEKLKEKSIVHKFYLAGGTALALQLGHRKSIDLDFFSDDFPKNEIILGNLKDLNIYVTQESEGTVDLLIDTVKVSFLEYKYPLLTPLVDFEEFKMASIRDIACMKLSAISSRGSKKDFVDFYKILQTESLNEIFSNFEKKFEGIEYQKSHILKSLLTFESANDDPDPDYIEKIDWVNVKRSIEKDVKNYLDTLQVSQ